MSYEYDKEYPVKMTGRASTSYTACTGDEECEVHDHQLNQRFKVFYIIIAVVILAVILIILS